MYQTVKVAETSAISPQYRRIVIQSPEMAQASQPGQFMMLKAWEGTVPFLMRPISINDADLAAGTVSFLYKVVGEGTAEKEQVQYMVRHLLKLERDPAPDHAADALAAAICYTTHETGRFA